MIQVLHLGKQYRRRQRNFIFKAIQGFHPIAKGAFGMVGANADAFSAIDAALPQNTCLAIAYPDGLGGAALNAVDAPAAQVFI